MGFPIGPPSVERVPIGLILLVRTAGTICLSRIFGLDGFIPNFGVVTPYQRFQRLGWLGWQEA
jgi:hypothetical protein